MRRAALLSLVACGRIGFDPHGDVFGDGSVAPDEIALRVVSDEGATTPAGVAIAGADVIVDRGAGSERMLTDANGGVRFSTSTNANIVVVYDRPDAWHVYTLDAVPPGTGVTVGGRILTSPTEAQMMFSVPVLSGAQNYYLFLSRECEIPGTGSVPSSTPVFTHRYAKRCEGRSVQVSVLAVDGVPVGHWLDGTVTLAAGTTATMTGPYAASSSNTITLNNVMPSVAAITTHLAIVSDGEARVVTDIATIPMPGTVVVNANTSPTIDMVSISAYLNPIDTHYARHTDDLFITPGTNTLTFDTTTALPFYNDIQLAPDARSAQWQPSAAGRSPQMVVFNAQIAVAAKVTTWTAYLPPDATTAQFPSLPADLIAADPMGGAWRAASATAFATPSETNLYGVDVSANEVLARMGWLSQSTAQYTYF